MGGTVSLPATVEVAFGANPLDTGTLTWTDISAYVKRTRGIDASRGWDAESSQPMAGRMQFQVNNDDGRFTPGTTGAFGLIRNRLPVRLKQGSTVLWTGLVETWKVSWESGLRSLVDVTCVDRWAAIRRTKLDRDRIALAAQITGRTMHWKFEDGPATFAESTGAGQAFQPGTGASNLSAGSVLHPTGDSQLPQVLGISATGVQMTTGGLGTTFSLDTGFSMSLVVRTSGWNDTAENVALELRSPDTGTMAWISLYYNGSGKLDAEARLQSTLSPNARGIRALTQDAWHVVTATYKRTAGTTTVSLYVDGTFINSDSAATADLGTPQWFKMWPDFDAPHTMQLGGLILHPLELTAAQAGLLGRQVVSWTGQTADTRGAGLVEFAPVTLTTTGTFTSTMSLQDLADKSLGDALQECATAEGGTIYMSTAGWPVLTSRSWRTSASVAFTIPAKALGADVTWTLDDQQLTNSASVDRMVGDTTAGSVKAKNDTSVTTYGEQNTSVQIWVDTDAQLLERANAEANMWANPLPRSSELVVDMATKGATLSAATVLAADVGNRIAVSGMPATAPTQTEFFIESIADKITEKGWTRTFTVSPRLDYFTVENATFGVIDSTNVLAF